MPASNTQKAVDLEEEMRFIIQQVEKIGDPKKIKKSDYNPIDLQRLATAAKNLMYYQRRINFEELEESAPEVKRRILEECLPRVSLSETILQEVLIRVRGIKEEPAQKSVVEESSKILRRLWRKVIHKD